MLWLFGIGAKALNTNSETRIYSKKTKVNIYYSLSEKRIDYTDLRLTTVHIIQDNKANEVLWQVGHLSIFES